MLFSFEKKQNVIAQKQVDFFKNNKKYLEKLYVELDDTKEVIRYFIYGSKWKQKLVSTYNFLFDNPDGDIFKENIKDCYFKLVDPTRMLELTIMDECIGYYYVLEEDITPVAGIMSSTLYFDKFNSNLFKYIFSLLLA